MSKRYGISFIAKPALRSFAIKVIDCVMDDLGTILTVVIAIK